MNFKSNLKQKFDNAKQYYKTRNYKSAIIALENFENDFPDSSLNEEGSYLKILSQYLISINVSRIYKKIDLERQLICI